MARTVLCRKLKKELPGLELPPFPGKAGEDIFYNVSKQAWAEWMTHQTTLINEKHLSMMDLTARTYLAEQRTKYFAGEEFDKADGYVPPTE